VAALERAQRRGLVGDSPLADQLAHAEGFAQTVEAHLGVAPGSFRGRWVDLGSGGGLPGLILADRWPLAPGVFLDGSVRSGEFLAETVRSREWGSRVGVVVARAEDVGRDPAYRASFDVVVARSFGPPPVVAECAAPLLKVDGILVVSEPPPEADRTAEDHEGRDRWPAVPLARLGLEPLAATRFAYGYRVLRQGTPCPNQFPRRVGVPRKRPLY